MNIGDNTARLFLVEPRERHTMRCQEAQQFGGVHDERRSPTGSCVCSELERLHDDWKALRELADYDATERGLDEYGAVTNRRSLLSFARSKAALDDLHERIIGAAAFEAGSDDLTNCPICAAEEGP